MSQRMENYNQSIHCDKNLFSINGKTLSLPGLFHLTKFSVGLPIVAQMILLCFFILNKIISIFLFQR